MDLSETIKKYGYFTYKSIRKEPMIIKIRDDQTLIMLEANIVKITKYPNAVGGDITNIVNITTYTPSEARKASFEPTQDASYDLVQEGNMEFIINDPLQSKITLIPVIIQIMRTHRLSTGEPVYVVNTQVKMITDESNPTKTA